MKILKEGVKDIGLNKLSGYSFHNRSSFDFDKIVAEGQNLSNIKFGKIPYNDQPIEEKSDYQISNPLFGVDWAMRLTSRSFL